MERRRFRFQRGTAIWALLAPLVLAGCIDWFAFPPAAPTGVAAAAGNGSVTISWTVKPGVDGYNLYWGTAGGVTKANGLKIQGATSPYVHAGLSNGTTYYYIVTAETSHGESPDSAQVQATPTP
jgi:hypothetical protein